MELVKDELLNLKDTFESDYEAIQPIIDNTCRATTVPLEELISRIHTDIIAPGIDTATTIQLEQALMELSHEIYCVNSACNNIAILDSISKINQEDAYNTSYLSPNIDKPKPTVAEITAYAENASLMEAVLHDIYNKSYKICKSKIDYAQLLLNSINKILSIRLATSGSSDIDSDKATKTILNEAYAGIYE